MDLALLSTLFGIAILDSINPSAIAVTLVQLASGKNSISRSLAYVLGIFITYTLIGIILFLAYQTFGVYLESVFSAIPAFLDNPPLWQYYLQLIIGIALIIYASFYFKSKPRKTQENKTKEVKSGNSVLSSFILGVSITAVESVTALPYLGAISVLHVSKVGLMESILYILFFNVVFVLPPLFLIGLYFFFNKSFESVVSMIRNFFAKHIHTILRFGFILLGLLLAAESLVNIF